MQRHIDRTHLTYELTPFKKTRIDEHKYSDERLMNTKNIVHHPKNPTTNHVSQQNEQIRKQFFQNNVPDYLNKKATNHVNQQKGQIRKQFFQNNVPDRTNQKASNQKMRSDQRNTVVAKLIPDMRHITIRCIVIDVNFKQTLHGQLCEARLADHTGSVIINIWDKEMADYIKPSQIWQLKEGITRVHHKSLHLALTNASKFLKVDEFCMNYVESPDLSAKNLFKIDKKVENDKKGLNGV